jgi:hypothetical protein
MTSCRFSVIRHVCTIVFEGDQFGTAAVSTTVVVSSIRFVVYSGDTE